MPYGTYRTHIAAALLSCLLFIPSVARAFSSQDPPVLPPGGIRAVAAAGPVTQAREPSWGLEASLRVGVASRLELAAPLALGIVLVDAGPGSGIYTGIGVVDLWVTEERKLLLQPAAVLAGQARFGPEAALVAAVDLSGVEQYPASGAHPAWLRGAAGLIIDAGPWVTIAVGISFQRIFAGDGPPAGAWRTGWVGDARFSLGAVRARPFSDLPTLAVHLADWLDLLALIRFDVDTDTRTTDSRWLFGFGLNR